MAAQNGTMPLVAPEPWGWAKQFADRETALYKLFEEQRWQAQQNDLNRAQQHNMQSERFAEDRARMESQNALSNSQQEANFAFQRERDNSRMDFQRDRDQFIASQRGTGISPGAPIDQYRPAFRQAEIAKGIPEGYLDVTAEIESAGGRNTRSTKSSANGVFQITKGTAKQLGVKNTNDPIESAVATAEYARQNGAMFKSAFGRDARGEELYLMHQQGPAGGLALLRNPNAPAVDVLNRAGANGLAAVLNNGGTAFMSAGQFAQRIMGKYASISGRRSPSAPAVQEAPPTNEPPSAPTQQPTPTSDPMQNAGKAAGATIGSALSGGNKVYTVGDTIPGKGTVTKVTPRTYVVVDPTGKPAYIMRNQ